MATDPNTQNVYITGSDLPDWATEQSQQRIVDAIKTGSANVYKATTVNANIGANMNALLSQLVMIMKGDKESARKFQSMIQEQTEVRKQLAELNNGIKIVADNTDPGKASTPKPDDKIEKDSLKEYRKLNWFEQMKLRRDLAGAKNDSERNHILRDMLQQAEISNGKLDTTIKDVLKNKALGLGAGAEGAVGGGADSLGSILSLVGGGSAAKVIEAATAVYAASQVPLQMMMQQVKDRFEITTELRQSGLLEDLGQSFVDVTKGFSDNSMTIVEATQFVREFSKAVGVMGTGAALKFVNQMAYSTDMMQRFGLNFSQVAKISGTYLDTLERTGMLEQISASSRDRGMKSFMSAVEGVSMTLKTSLEESAKMISEYLSRDDISAMLMTSSSQLSQEVITQIGAMAKMGPLGEIVAKGAIDPNRFMLTPEFQKLNNPALAGVRGIVEQMMNDLRSGRGTDELIAQYGKRMSDIIKNDPVVGQLVAMDSDVASIVAGVGRLAQTSQDAIKDIVPPAVDQAERRRQDAERRRNATIEGLYANVLKTLDTSRDLETILNDQTFIIDSQIKLIDNLARKADGFAASIIDLGNSAHNMVIGTLTELSNGITDLFPEHHVAGQQQNIGDTTSDIADIQENRRRNAMLPSRDGSIPGVTPQRAAVLEQTITDLQSGWARWLYESDQSKLDRIQAMEDLKNTVAKTDKEKEYIDSYIKKLELEMAPTQAGGRMSGMSVESFLNKKSYEIGRHDFDTLQEIASGATDATTEEKATATQQVLEAQSYAMTTRLKDILPQISDSAGGLNDVNKSILAQETVNAMHETGMTEMDVKKVIDELFNDTTFVESLKGNAEDYKSVLISEIQPTSTDTNPNNTDGYTLGMKAATIGIESAITSALKDGTIDDTDLEAISSKVANRAAQFGLSGDQVNTIVEGLKSNEQLKEQLGNNFDAVSNALNGFNRPQEQGVEPIPTTQDVVTVPSGQTFLDVMSSNGTSPVTEGVNSELYTVMADLTGGIGDDFNQAAQTQFSDFLMELKNDKQLSNEQMVAKLNEVVTNITKNQPKLEEATGNTDVKLLLGAIQDLIRKLQ